MAKKQNDKSLNESKLEETLNNKNVISRLLETVSNIRTLPRPDIEDRIPVAKSGETLPELMNNEINMTSILSMGQLDTFRTLSRDRENLYKSFDEMMQDSVVSTVIEIYADEACQYNEDGKIIWAESDDKDVSKYVNDLLEKLRIEDNCWDHIYQLVYLGDLYLETFDNLHPTDTHKPDILTEPYRGAANVSLQNRPDSLQKEEYVEQVNNPANIYDITYRGKTEGFIKIPEDEMELGLTKYLRKLNKNKDRIQILDPTKYVHICLNNSKERYPETLILESKDGNEVEFKIKKGRSILEDVYKAYQNLKLMKDSLLLNRINRSSRVRILQVEVGDLPKNEKSLMLKRLKDKVEQKNIMDKMAGKFNSQAAPGPADNIIYSTTTNGKGAITMSDLGENLNVSAIADLEPFENEFYGKVRVSKAILGANMDGTGLSNGGTLSQQDSIFARAIKRIQNAYTSGIETLVNIFILNKLAKNGNMEMQNKYIGKFKIKMTSPSTTQDKDRDESFKQKIDSIKNFMDLIGTEDIIDASTKKDIIKYFVTNMLNKQDIADMIEKDEFLKVQEEQEEKEAKENSELMSGTGFEDSGSNDFPGSSDNSDLFDEEPVSDEDNTETEEDNIEVPDEDLFNDEV